jgi:hypothetical protein
LPVYTDFHRRLRLSAVRAPAETGAFEGAASGIAKVLYAISVEAVAAALSAKSV